MLQVIDNIKRLEVKSSRWSAVFKATLEDDSVLEFVASADSGITYGDGIFLGTREEYDEAEAGAF